VEVAVAMLGDDGIAGFTTRKVVEGAATSIPAVYELFGDKAGLIREVFFEGFRQLRRRFEQLEDSDDPLTDLGHTIEVFRSFVGEHPVLAEVMFSRPFADFDPKPEELEASGSVRAFIVGHVRRCIDAGLMVGDEIDIAHVLLALAQGLAAQETAGWLGSSPRSRDRRWALAFRAAFTGLGPTGSRE
jgi:AcrR family transcriptional regulator